MPTNRPSVSKFIQYFACKNDDTWWWHLGIDLIHWRLKDIAFSVSILEHCKIKEKILNANVNTILSVSINLTINCLWRDTFYFATDIKVLKKTKNYRRNERRDKVGWNEHKCIFIIFILIYHRFIDYLRQFICPHKVIHELVWNHRYLRYHRYHRLK